MKTNFILGEYDATARAKDFKDFFDTFKEIQLALGKKSYMISSYFALVLSMADLTDMPGSIYKGFEDDRLYFICQRILAKEPFKEEHLFNRIAQDFIEKHPLEKLDSEILIRAYSLALSEQYLSYAIDEYKDSIRAFNDRIECKALYYEISKLIGEDLMSKFYDLMINIFFPITLINAYIQGFRYQLFAGIRSLDQETRLYVFELYLKLNSK